MNPLLSGRSARPGRSSCARTETSWGCGFFHGRRLDRWRVDALRRPVRVDFAIRRVEIAGIPPEPDSAGWSSAVASSPIRMMDACAGNGFCCTTAIHASPTGLVTRWRWPAPRRSDCRRVRQISRVRGAVRENDQGIWPEPLDLRGRALTARCDSRVRRTLPSRTKPARHEHPIALPPPRRRLTAIARLRVVRGWVAYRTTTTGLPRRADSRASVT